MKFLAKLFEYGGQTQLSSMRAMMAKTLLRSRKQRLAWRAFPRRAPNDKSVDGEGGQSMAKIKEYAAAGCLPYWMQKGASPHWTPTDRRDTLPRSEVNDLPESEWFMWIAGIVDEIEDAGTMQDFKIVDNKYNSFREHIVDKVCVQAFGTKNPTKSTYF